MSTKKTQANKTSGNRPRPLVAKAGITKNPRSKKRRYGCGGKLK